MVSSNEKTKPGDVDEMVGQIRRIGRIGPIYEVMGIDEEGVAEIRLVETGRTERYPVAEIKADPALN